jgi:hypothetical protein
VTTLHDFGGVLGSQFHGHGSWLVCEVALRVTVLLVYCFQNNVRGGGSLGIINQNPSVSKFD